MIEAEMAQRALVARMTIRRLEAGDLSVSLAVLAQVLEILGLDGDLDRIAAVDDLGQRLGDPAKDVVDLGQRLADARLPRPSRRPERNLADAL